MHNKTRSQRDMSHAVLYATGPWLLRDAFKEFSGEAGDLAAGYAGAHAVKGTHVMIYALGQWCDAPLACPGIVSAWPHGMSLLGPAAQTMPGNCRPPGCAHRPRGSNAVAYVLGQWCRCLSRLPRHGVTALPPYSCQNQSSSISHASQLSATRGCAVSRKSMVYALNQWCGAPLAGPACCRNSAPFCLESAQQHMSCMVVIDPRKATSMASNKCSCILCNKCCSSFDVVGDSVGCMR